MEKFGSLIFILFGLGAMYFAKTQYDVSRKLVTSGIRTAAEVVDIIEVDDDEGSTTYKSVFEYTDQSNTVKRVNNSYSSKPTTHDIGEIVQIVYSSDSKEVRVSSFWGFTLYLSYKSMFKFFLPENQYLMNLDSHQISCLSR